MLGGNSEPGGCIHDPGSRVDLGFASPGRGRVWARGAEVADGG
jgi:hypothetical protein